MLLLKELFFFFFSWTGLFLLLCVFSQMKHDGVHCFFFGEKKQMYNQTSLTVVCAYLKKMGLFSLFY